jgi:hypothetical protein
VPDFLSSACGAHAVGFGSSGDRGPATLLYAMPQLGHCQPGPWSSGVLLCWHFGQMVTGACRLTSGCKPSPAEFASLMFAFMRMEVAVSVRAEQHEGGPNISAPNAIFVAFAHSLGEPPLQCGFSPDNSKPNPWTKVSTDRSW